MSGTYNILLVMVSYFVAVIASFTALEVVRRVLSTSGKASKIWLWAGSLVMGFGIWTMHFVGMLAFEMNMIHTYDLPITLFSLLVGMASSWLAIYIASSKSRSNNSFIIAGIFLGLGIVSMHYTGMKAMRMNAEVIYDPVIVIISVLVAIVAAIAALFIVNYISESESKSLWKLKLFAAMVMGFAICGMHYTGMAAATYIPLLDSPMMMGAGDHQSLAVLVTGAALFILGLTHLTIFFDYKLGEQKIIGDKLQRMVDERTSELLHQKNDLQKSKEKIEKEIVERKEAEKESNHLSTLLDHSLNEIYVFDAETLKYTNVNQGASTNLSYSKHELLSMTPLDILPDNVQDEFKQRLSELSNTNNEHLTFESFHTKSDGAHYPVGINLQLSNALGKTMFIAIVQDISERKDLEHKLNRAQRLESIGQLAAGVAHEINTPTQFVGDNIRFLKDGFEDIFLLQKRYEDILERIKSGADLEAIDKEIQDYIKELDLEYLIEEIPRAITQSLDGISHIANIVQAMKEFSHPGGNEKKPIDLNSAINSVITVSSNEWKYAAEIEKNFDDNLPLVPCLAQEFSQVMLNLIVNAAHAIADTNSKDSSHKGKIIISTSSAEGETEIRIQDTGGGIPKNIQEKVFDPFFTTKEVGKGTGQGLSIAYASVVDKMEGTLSFEVEEGVGTTFIIKLPMTTMLALAS